MSAAVSDNDKIVLISGGAVILDLG